MGCALKWVSARCLLDRIRGKIFLGGLGFVRVTAPPPIRWLAFLALPIDEIPNVLAEVSMGLWVKVCCIGIILLDGRAGGLVYVNGVMKGGSE